MSTPGFRHEAFLYDSDDEFVGRMAEFLAAGLDEGAPGLAVTSRSHCALLRDGLGAASDRVRFVDRDDWFVRPANTIAAYDATLRDLARGGAASIRVVGEVQFGPTAEEWRDWTAYEAILNRALAEHPAWFVCPYDRRVLPEQVVEAASRTHPEVLTDTRHRSDSFSSPEETVLDLTPAHEPLDELRALPLAADAVSFRERLAAELAAAKVPEATALNMLVAANEVAVNALRHGGGTEAIRAGRVDGHFVCEISDRGPGLADPLAGYLPPNPEAGRGAGLWTARQLVSRLELISAGDGLTVRLWV